MLFHYLHQHSPIQWLHSTAQIRLKAGLRTATPRARRWPGSDRSSRSLSRVEQVELGLVLALHDLGLLEERSASSAPLWCRGIGGGGAFTQPMEGIAAAVSKHDGLAGVGHRLLDPAQCQFQLAEAVADGALSRLVLRPSRRIPASTDPPPRLRRLEGSEAEGGFVLSSQA